MSDWNDIKLLTVAVDRLRRWYRPGLVCLGDAAHAMSPIGGVGINLAVQDAVAAANILAPYLESSGVSTAVLRRVQRRRAFPAIVTQRAQVLIQNRIIRPILASSQKMSPPPLLRAAMRRAWMRRLAARMVGIGVRPEHVRTPDIGRRTAA